MAKKMTDKTGRSLVEFWDYAAQKGWMNSNTAAGYRAACQRVLEVQPGWESMDVSQIDPDDLFHRFQNLKAAEYSPGSLGTYRSRFAKGVATYLDWADNPSAWKARAPSRRGRARKTPSKSIKNGVHRGSVEKESPSTQPMIDIVEYPFPVRENLLAKLVLPRDLTKDEARRLGAFVDALAVDRSGSAADES